MTDDAKGKRPKESKATGFSGESRQSTGRCRDSSKTTRASAADHPQSRPTMGNQHQTDARSDLRKRAEAVLAGDETPLSNASREEMSTLLHELHTHQIELELQNEELRRAQAELVERRDQYASLYDFAPVGYVTLSHEGTIQQANLQLTEMLGVPRSKVLGLPLSAFVVPEDADTYYRHWHKTPDSARPSTCELRMKGPDGEAFWVEIKHVVDPSPQETGAGFRCVISDITERRQAEEALRESEMLSRALLEGSPVCNKIIDLDFKLRYISAAGVRQLKISDIEPYYGQTYPPEFYPASMRTPLLDNLKRAMAGEIASVEAPVHDTEGNEVWYHTTFVPARDDDGDVKFVIASSVEITERKRAEQALRRNGHLLAKAQELGRIGTWELDIVNNVLVWTEENYRLFGVPVGTALTYEVFLSCVHPDDREYVDREWTIRMKTNDYDIEHRLIVDGQVRWVREKAEISFDDAGKPVRAIGFTHDITERKRADGELIRRAEFERVICETSSDIAGLGVGQLDSGIGRALSRIGEFTNADRAYVFEFNDGGTLMDNTYEWCREGVEPQIEGLKGICLHEELPWFAKCITAHDTIRIPDVTALPPEAQLEREHFESQDIRSLVVVPMLSRGELTGFLGFDSVRERRDWTEEETVLLRLVSETIAHALGRVADEKALRESRRELAEIFTMSLHLVCIADISEAKFLKVNPAFTRVLGYDEAEVVNHPFSDFIHPDDVEPTRKVVEDELRRGKKVLGFTNRYRCKDGTWRWLEWTSHPQPERGITIAVARDITERKQAEERLRLERDFAESLVETAQAIVLVLDRQGRIVRFNRYMEELSGYQLAEVKGADWFTTFPSGNDRARVRELFRQAVDGIQAHGNVSAILTKDGQLRDIEWYDPHTLSDAQGKVTGLLAVGHDVTERKRAEEKALRQQYLLAKAQELGQIGAWELDLRQNKLYWTDENCRIFGVASGSVVNYEVFLGKVHPDDREYVHREWSAALDGKPYDIEHRLDIDGAIRWVREKADVTLDEAGRAVSAIGFTQDITERKQAGEELRRRNAQLSAAETVARMGSWEYDVANDTAVWSDNMFPIFDVDPAQPDELVFKAFVENLVHPDDRERIVRCLETALAGGAPYNLEYRVLRRNGEERIIHARAEIEWDATGKPRRMIGIVQDITERKQSEQELRAERNRFSSIVNAMSDGLTIQDLGHNITYQNETVTNVFGEHLGEKCYRVYEGKDEVCDGCPVEMAFKDGKSHTSVRTVKMPSGKTRIWENTANPIRDADGTIVSCLEVANEITERRQVEERLHQAEKMEAIGQLAGGVAHDFNNQLAGIMNYADLLLAKTQDVEQHTYIEAIIRSCTRGRDLTGQLLAFSRKGKYQVIPVNIHMAIAEVVSMLGRSSDKRVTIRQRLDANPPMTIGDQTQLQNALLNLGLNARDAMPDGGELVFATDTVTLGEADCVKSTFDITVGDYLRIRVTDSGTGMDEEIRAHLFEPFFTTKEQGKGTGMGLASVYGTVVSHHGAIEVQSEVGKGTTMTVYLPLSRQEVQGVVEAAGTSPGVKGTVRILMVDDEKSVRESTAALLRNEGYRVVTAKDGGEAVEYYAKSWEHVDLVILDMNMPVMNGRDTFVAMRRINPEIKALLATGYSLDSNAQEILDEGALFHIQKPFRIHDLVPQIQQALSG